MWWFVAVLLVLSPAILYALLLVLGAVYRGRCLACGKRGLKCANAFLATVKIDGRRAPDSWSYYICERCGAAFKLHQGQWSRVSLEETQEV
jgi:hypothetical protein